MNNFENIKTNLIIGKSLSQASTRLGQMKAFQKRMNGIEKYAVYFGKFEDENGFNYFDGCALFNNKKLTEAINVELENQGTPFFVSEDTILGQGFQARPYSIKSFFLSVTVRTIVHAIRNRCGGDSNVVTLHVPTMTEEQYNDFVSALNKHKDSPYWGKVVVVTMTEEAKHNQLDFLADMNAFKAPFNPRLKNYFNVMETSHKSHKKATMSSQMAKTLFAADSKMASELILKKTEELIAKAREKMELTEAMDACLSDLFGDMSQLMQLLRPDFVREQSASMYRTQVGNLVEGLTKTINKLKFEIDGKYCAVIPELSLLFCDKKLLNWGESYCPGYEGKKSIFVKYPKMGNHEFYKSLLIFADDYISRAVGVMSKDAFNEFKNLVRHLGEGLVVVCAIPELLLLIAGMDFDGDKVEIVIEEIILKIFELIESIVAAIE